VLITAERPPRRAPRSLRAEYDEFIEQRIEEYKEGLARAEILSIGDEAMHELAGADQLQLTEVVLRDQVDAIIRRRLRLPSFRRWRERHVALRAAQSQPGHWGLAAHDPVTGLAELIEDGDPVLVVGVVDGACALFLAAHRARVHVVDPDISLVVGLENRAVTEQLGAQIECEVARLERYAPAPESFAAVVIETGAIARLPAADRSALVERLCQAVPPGGRHAVMPGGPDRGPREPRLASDALRTLYGGWDIVLPPPSGGRRSRNSGFAAVRPLPAPASD
jgi:hypothetical protein